ncbi:GyrI-like domain-containing protein [Anaerotalea alkaliphila]|uniref:GyrI-like domain-containing protein n=1 Tax=Anaerotalea alkaliphila TaxID=2662126 RepID=A0A7X5HXK6_9FIRM|nr:GyrI-like domain-containing protein [Anaerotalea alkaliphila]NDL68468.1 GyrI-like domain-containing protein [Anaerotalea alkaliphila]
MEWKIGLEERAQQPTLSIRTTVTMEALPSTIGECYGRIAAYLGELGEQPAGIPFTAYRSLDLQNIDVEMGFPVAKPLPGRDNIQAGEIPAGLVVASRHRGPYAAMEKLYENMFQWIEDNNYVSTGVYYEFYVNSPVEVPEMDLVTRVELPVVRK